MGAVPRSQAPHVETAETSLWRRAAEVIEAQRLSVRESLPTAIDGRDPEGVHRMRVASRRLRVALKLFGPYITAPDTLVGRVERDTRNVTRALGDVRESDVLRLRLERMLERAQPARALAVEHLIARIRRRQRRQRATMMRRFAKVDMDRLDLRLKRLTTSLGSSAGQAARQAAGPTARATSFPPRSLLDGDAQVPGSGQVGGSSLDQLIPRIAPRLVEEAGAILRQDLPPGIGSEAAVTALHQVRIQAKKLRYALELLAPQLGEAGQQAVGRLKKLQTRLGSWHDTTVLEGTVRDEAARSQGRDRPRLGSELRRLRRLLRRALLRQEQGVRAEIIRLSEDDFMTRLAALLGWSGSSLASEDAVGSVAELEDVAPHASL